MFCEMYANQGILYLYDELEPVEKLEFESHLQGCKSCQVELELLEQSRVMTQALPVEDILPISYAQYAKSKDEWFVKKLQNAIAELWSLLPSKKRIVFAPAFAAVLVLIVILIIKPTPQSTNNLASWDAGLEDSLTSVEEKIAEFKIEHSFDVNSFSEEYDLVDSFTDERLSAIEADIQMVSIELNSLEF